MAHQDTDGRTEQRDRKPGELGTGDLELYTKGNGKLLWGFGPGSAVTGQQPYSGDLGVPWLGVCVDGGGGKIE